MKLKSLFMLTLVVFILSACSNISTGDEIGEKGNLVDIGDFGPGMDLIRDKDTGCVYIYRESGHQFSVSAYYGEDGKVVGCGEEQFDKSKYE